MYAEFARVAFVSLLAYRLRYFTGWFTYLVYVSVYYYIWQAVYADGGGTRGGYSAADMVTYVAVGWIARSCYFNNVDRDIHSQVVEGGLARDLVRPVSFQAMYLARALGESLFRVLLFTIPISFVVAAIYPLAPPAGVAAAAAFLCSLPLALLVMAALNFLVGLAAIHMRSALGLIGAKHFIVQLASGLLIPLSFFPDSVRTVLEAAPFAAISWVPVSLYMGRIEALGALGFQAAWAAALLAAGAAAWRYSARRVVIQGG